MRLASGCLAYRKADGTIIDTCTGGPAADPTTIFPASTLWLHDDFDVHESGAASGIGRLAWAYTGNVAIVRTTEAANPGIVTIGENSSGSNVATLHTSHTASVLSGGNTRGPLLANLHSFKARFWFAAMNIDTNSEYRIGFASGRFDTAAEPAEGVFLRKTYTNQNWHAACVSGGTPTLSTDIVAASAGSWVNALLIEKDGSNVKFTFPGQAAVSIGGVPTVGLCPYFAVWSQNLQANTMKVDRFDLYITGLAR